MFFKKKDEKKLLKKVVNIRLNFYKTLEDGTTKTWSFDWVFKDLSRYSEYTDQVNKYSKNTQKYFLDIEEYEDSLYFFAPSGWTLYEAACEIIDYNEEE